MEPDPRPPGIDADRPDPWVSLLNLLRQLPTEARQPLTDWLGGLTTSDVRAYAGLAEAAGTALPAAIRVEPAILRLSAGEVTLTTGPPPVSPGVRWPAEAVKVALIVYVLLCASLLAHPGPDPLSGEQVALIGAALALLAWQYPRPQQ